MSAIKRPATRALEKIRLTYLDMKGVAEPIRLALFVGDVPFEDRRVSYEQVAAMRESGELLFGQVPLLEVDDEPFQQSQGILRWAGRRAGLYPEDLMLRCDEVEEALVDIRKLLMPQWYGVIMGRDPRTGEKLVPMTDGQKQDVEQTLNENILPARLAQLERRLNALGGPYFCGGKLTTCDLSFYVFASGVLDGTYAPGVRPCVLDACPDLRKLAQKIAEHPKVREWSEKQAKA